MARRRNPSTHGVHYIHYNKDYNTALPIIFHATGVHYIHYNKDYNSILTSSMFLIGVHHIHYNKDYNYRLSLCVITLVYTISIITRITTMLGALMYAL